MKILRCKFFGRHAFKKSYISELKVQMERIKHFGINSDIIQYIICWNETMNEKMQIITSGLPICQQVSQHRYSQIRTEQKTRCKHHDEEAT